MSLTLIVLWVIAVLVIGALVVLARKSRSGTNPGLADGQLRPCADKGNCVCSEYPDRDTASIQPVKLSASNLQVEPETLATLLINDGAKIVEQSDNYVAATYASKFFGFVDDVEFRIDHNDGVIHIRSASRVGRSDLGANRSRVERLRGKISTLQP